MDQEPFAFFPALIGYIAGLLTAVAVGLLRRPAAARWNRIRERLQGARRWVSSGVESRYRQETANFVQRCHLGRASARLDEVFVPTPFIAPPPEPSPAPGGIVPHPQIHYLWPELGPQLATAPPPCVPVGDAVLSTDRLAVIAPPGGGKSTLLAYLALRYAEDPEFVPLYAHLAELSVEPLTKGGDSKAEEPLLRALQRRAGPLTADALPDLLRKALGEQRAVILLDGWDELSVAERHPYTRWIEQLVGSFPGARFVVAAPSVGFGPFLRQGFSALHLRPWRPEEATELLLKWARVLNAAVPTLPVDEQLGAEEVPDLSFWQPGQTPLDTMLAVSLTLAGRTPSGKQAQRFGAACQQLLEQSAGKEADWTQVGLGALARLAGWMDETDTRICPLAVFEQIVADLFDSHKEVARRDLHQTVDALLEASGLLAPWCADRLTFRTPALFSYFWSAQQALTKDNAAVLQRVHDPEWSHAISFLIEIADSGPLVERLLLAPADGTKESLFRVADWLARAGGTEQWHRIVMVRLAQVLLNSETPAALRERAAAALVATRDEGVGFLLRQALTSPNAAVRQVAAAGLGALAPGIPGLPVDQRSLDALVKILDDPSEGVQAAAISALGSAGSKTAVEALVQTMLGSNATARRLAAEALGRMGREGPKILEEALTEQEVLVRRAALYGLAQVQDGWVNTVLAQVAHQDGEWFIRSTAEELLNERLTPPAVEKIGPVRPENLSWFISLAAERGQGVPAGPRALELLKETLEERQRPAVRAMAARSLGDIAEPGSSPLIAEALRDSDHQVREAAFFALARLNRAWDQTPT